MGETPKREWTRDARLVLAAKAMRSFGYGLMGVTLPLYLVEAGYGPGQVGLVLTATLVGSILLTAAVTSSADRLGRRRMLLLSSALMAVSGVVFGWGEGTWLLGAAALTGTISPTSGEVGPFETIESAILPQTSTTRARNRLFGWYSAAGAVAVALGALAAGLPAVMQHRLGLDELTSYRWMFALYAAAAGLSALALARLSPRVELARLHPRVRILPLRRSRATVTKLAALFALDSFGGGFVIEAMVVYWFSLRFGAGASVLAPLFSGANVMKALSYVAAVRLADRIGLVRTMVFTHLPSNILLILLPLMPSLPLAMAMLLARHALAQMDVPTRSSYLVAVVDPEERTAATGLTTLTRMVTRTVGPALAGIAFQWAQFGVPFFMGGGLKVIYDLALYANFRALKPPEEQEV